MWGIKTALNGADVLRPISRETKGSIGSETVPVFRDTLSDVTCVLLVVTQWSEVASETDIVD